MADVITRFKLETTQFDSKLRDTAKALQGIAHQAELGGKDFNNFNQKAIETARALGTVQSGANNTKDKLRDLVGSYNDAAKAYNSLTETAKKGEFGQAMSQSLTQLQQRIRETKEELYGLGDGMKGASGGSLFSSDKLSGMLQVFGGNLMTKGAGMALSFAGELKDMVAQGIELAKAGEGVRLAFQRLGRGDILQGLREATHGTVTDLELMKAAVKFNDFKLPLDELGTMLAFAQQKAKDTGQSVDYMVDSIVTGLGRKSLMILDNLGLSAAEVKEKMAETGDMTKAVGAIIREQMSKAGDYVETAADRATQANVSLQNKMEELGRKFGPLEQASSNLWTSIKIGIMDIVGGPLTDFLNKLTEAGRLAQKYSVLGGSGKVGRMINNLSGAREGNRQSIYQQQQEQFWRYINPREQQIRDIRAWQRGERGEALQKRVSAITEKYGSLDATKIQAEVDAARKMLAEYQQSAKQILTPVKADIKTDEAEQNVASLTKKLKELKKLRDEAINKKDFKARDTYNAQIKQVNAEIKSLRGSTTTTTTTKQTPQQRAQESFAKAEQNYKQALEQAAMELQAGTITRAEAKKKEMQAAEARWKAIGDARNISDSENLRKAQDEAAANYKALAAEVKTATEHQKAIDKATRDLENANQKLAAARTEMAQAKQQGDLQAYNTAKDKATAAQKEITRLEKVKVDVETGTVNLPEIPKVIEQTVNTHQGELMTADIATEITQKINTVLGNIVKPEILDEVTQTINTKVGNVITPEIAKEVTQVVDVETGHVDLPDIPATTTTTVDFEANTRNIDAAISYVKKEMDTIPVGTIEFNLDQTKLADLTTLKTLITEQVKNGLQIDPNFAQSMFKNILAGKDIENTTWQAQVDNINKNRTVNGRTPLKINYKTGEKENDKEKEKKTTSEEQLQGIQTMVGSLQSIAGGINQLGIELPKELTNIFGVLQTITGIVGAIQSMQTVGAFLGIFHNGGVVPAFAQGGLIGRAADGMMIPGNSMSGDRLRLPVDGGRGMIGVNSGELILNRAQQGVIASALQGSNNQQTSGSPYVTGEMIFLGLNNYLKSTGRGEMMTSRFKG